MKKISFIVLVNILILFTNSAKAITIYDNNISALNINALSDVFMSYVNYGDNMFDLFEKPIVYGTMRRVDEYGDDGSTLSSSTSSRATDSFINNIWFNANHFNAEMHYGKNISEHSRLNLATVGATTKNIELNRGNISFGGFASYINTKISDTKSNGYSIGAFSNYKYNIFGAKALLDTGALNNRISGFKHDNSWFNIATSVYTDLKLDDTFYFEPSLYVGYMLVWSDELRVNSNKVTSRNYNFFNITPELKFIKKISDNWFGALSGKYVAHFGGKNDIRVNGIRQSGLYLDDHSDIGIDVEYRLNNFIFGGKIHAMLGGIDGWNSNLNIKYMF